MDRRPAAALSIAAASFLGLGLTACNGTAGSENNPNGLPSPSETTIIESMPPSSPENSLLSFGQEYTYPDDVTVTVDMTGTAFTSADYADTATLPVGTEIPVFTFTITNNSAEPISPDLETTFVTYGPETTRASQTFTDDIAGGALDIGTILPGNSWSEQRTYELPVGSEDIVVEYGIDTARETVLFTSE